MGIHFDGDWYNRCRGIWSSQHHHIKQAYGGKRDNRGTRLPLWELIQYKRAVVVSDLIYTLHNIQLERKHLPRFGVHHFGQLPILSEIRSFKDNEYADSLAEVNNGNNNLMLDSATVILCVSKQLVDSRTESTSYTVTFWRTRVFSSEVEHAAKGVRIADPKIYLW